MHIWSLSQRLIALGHKVIVVTHEQRGRRPGSRRVGVRVMYGGLKVYYLPYYPIVPGGVTLITFQAVLPLLRHIFLREGIDVVHGHAVTSALACEGMATAALLDVAAVYTDHSLYGLDDPGGLHLSASSGFVLRTCVRAAVCVSHACAENLCLRAGLHPAGVGGPRVRVLPNAVDARRFPPRDDGPPPAASGPAGGDAPVRVVFLARLTHRKGVPLLLRAIPEICAADPAVTFRIGGDGNLSLGLREMVEVHGLQHRVEMLGSVEPADVPAVLRSGRVFLNTSLTESFCMAILEAACAGLEVVSTDVGGVREVLPETMALLCAPTVRGVVDATIEAVRRVRAGEGMTPSQRHAAVAEMYSWAHVAEQTAEVYHAAVREQQRDRQTRTERVNPVLVRVRRYVEATRPGRVFGMPVPGPMGWFAICYALALEVMFVVWSYVIPVESVDVVPDFCGRIGVCNREIKGDFDQCGNCTDDLNHSEKNKRSDLPRWKAGSNFELTLIKS